jgi:hypothetical protein
MTDVQHFEDRFSRQLLAYATTGAPQIGREHVARAVATGVASRRRRRIGWPWLPQLATAAVIFLVVAIGFALWTGRNELIGPGATETPTTTATPTTTSTPTATAIPEEATAQPSSLQPTRSWTGPIQSGASAMPVIPMDAGRLCISEGPGRYWDDPVDAQAGLADITQTRWRRSGVGEESRWSIDLAAPPPAPSEVDADTTQIQYGLVLETNGDGTPDYEIGISSSSGDGPLRVWLSDLATGTTVEENGPTYGTPIEFVYPDEQEFRSGTMHLWFRGQRPEDLDDGDRYYAWSSYSENGSVVAWDYAPDYGWLELPPCESLPSPSQAPVALTPVRGDADQMPSLLFDGEWADASDASLSFVDITDVVREPGAGLLWSLQMAGPPPEADTFDSDDAILEYGLVVDADSDGTPDYQIGINGPPRGGSFHTWVTDLKTGVTDERGDRPYGVPFDFHHPGETYPDDPPELASELARTMRFFFLTPGFPAPDGLDGSDPFYAWASYSENGSVVATDHAPDFGWLDWLASEEAQ